MSDSIFISYAKDDFDLAMRLYEDLTAAGARPWIDAEDLLPGQDWKAIIRETIRDCDYFLAVLSSHSVGKRGYVQKEIKEALEVLSLTPESEVYIIPARIEDCQPSHAKLEDLHWVDLFPSYDAGLKKILRVVRPSKAVLDGRVTSQPIDNRADLAEAGWGVIFPEDMRRSIRDALEPLLALRHRQSLGRFREFSGALGYHMGDTVHDFLARHGAGPGPVDPDRVPYYLLLVGSPEEIPFSFQQQISIQYRVGRLAFDRSEDYARYATSVVEAESLAPAPRRAIFFGVQNDGDRPTELAVRNLVKPLSEAAKRYSLDWEVETILAGEATKNRLGALIGVDSPSLLFVVAHGMQFRPDDEMLFSDQGAILCQDWPGPRHWRGRIPSDYFFSASDVPREADLRGTILFYFGSFGAGTPMKGEVEWGDTEYTLAPRPFVSQIAKKLLSNDGGGALGLVGQIERGWSYSFHWQSAGPQIQIFEYALRSLMNGQPLGLALESFSQRYAELATTLANAVYGSEKLSDENEIIRLWTATVDARSFVIIGDPAVRIQ